MLKKLEGAMKVRLFTKQASRETVFYSRISYGEHSHQSNLISPSHLKPYRNCTNKHDSYQSFTSQIQEVPIFRLNLENKQHSISPDDPISYIFPANACVPDLKIKFFQQKKLKDQTRQRNKWCTKGVKILTYVYFWQILCEHATKTGITINGAQRQAEKRKGKQSQHNVQQVICPHSGYLLTV